jgi:hypothetical protein
MSFRIRTVGLAASLLCVGFAAQGQEGFPLDGTWRGTSGDQPVLILMKWDGKNINGTLNPGRNAVKFSKAVLEPKTWTVHFEAQAKDGTPIVIDAKLEDIGSVNRFLTGTWTQAGANRPFKATRE